MITGTIAHSGLASDVIPYTQHVAIKRGVRRKILLPAVGPWNTSDVGVYTFTADAPGDPLPGQAVSAEAKVFDGAWR